MFRHLERVQEEYTICKDFFFGKFSGTYFIKLQALKKMLSELFKTDSHKRESQKLRLYERVS